MTATSETRDNVAKTLKRHASFFVWHGATLTICGENITRMPFVLAAARRVPLVHLKADIHYAAGFWQASITFAPAEVEPMARALQSIKH